MSQWRTIDSIYLKVVTLIPRPDVELTVTTLQEIDSYIMNPNNFKPCLTVRYLKLYLLRNDSLYGRPFYIVDRSCLKSPSLIFSISESRTANHIKEFMSFIEVCINIIKTATATADSNLPIANEQNLFEYFAYTP